jgi:6-phosphogluconolactonase (cycloisomerase 2 family)
VTSFRIDGGALTVADVEPSGGLQPNSLDNFGSLLYVSNVGAISNGFLSNVTGFSIAGDGALTPIPTASYQLSTPTAQPASVLFSRDGSVLFVTELTTDSISAFPVNPDGTLGAATTTSSSGPGPFGAALLSSGALLVSEANPSGTGALTSYSIGAGGALGIVSGSIGNSQLATCWVAVRPNGSFAFTSNTGSSTISSYDVLSGNQLALIQGVASTLEGPSSGPIDLAVCPCGGFLYVLDGGIGAITILHIESDGSLTRIGAATNVALPALGSQGLAIL